MPTCLRWYCNQVFIGGGGVVSAKHSCNQNIKNGSCHYCHRKESTRRMLILVDRCSLLPPNNPWID